MRHKKPGSARNASFPARKGKPFRGSRSKQGKNEERPSRPGKSGFAKPKHHASKDRFAKDRRGDDLASPKRHTSKARFARDKRGNEKKKNQSTPFHKIRKETNQMPPRQGVLLWGLHAVHEAWLNPQRTCFNLWLTEAAKASFAGALGAAMLETLKRPSPLIVERNEIDRLLPPNSVHQGVALEVAPLAEPVLQNIIKGDNRPDLVVVLDQVTDPHNVGAILRSAAAFGAGAVIMTDRNAPSTTGILAKTASGAIEHVPLIHVTNLSRALGELQDAGYWCIGLAEDAQRHLAEIDLSSPVAVVLGNEGEGMRRLTRETCDDLARLPTGGSIGTLNVSNAAAVALYEARKQKARFE